MKLFTVISVSVWFKIFSLASSSPRFGVVLSLQKEGKNPGNQSLQYQYSVLLENLKLSISSESVMGQYFFIRHRAESRS